VVVSAVNSTPNPGDLPLVLPLYTSENTYLRERKREKRRKEYYKKKIREHAKG
jgi:hypothetical protein